MLSEEKRQELKEMIEEQHDNRAAAPDVLWALQREFGWLTDEAMEIASDLTGLTLIELDELATFYNLLFRSPVGDKVIFVCDSVSCELAGSDDLIETLQQELDVEMGGTSEDGAFTLLPIVCLGNCGNAPTMLVDKHTYHRVDPDKVADILEHERTE